MGSVRFVWYPPLNRNHQLNYVIIIQLNVIVGIARGIWYSENESGNPSERLLSRGVIMTTPDDTTTTTVSQGSEEMNIYQFLNKIRNTHCIALCCEAGPSPWLILYKYEEKEMFYLEVFDSRNCKRRWYRLELENMGGDFPSHLLTMFSYFLFRVIIDGGDKERG